MEMVREHQLWAFVPLAGSPEPSTPLLIAFERGSFGSLVKFCAPVGFSITAKPQKHVEPHWCQAVSPWLGRHGADTAPRCRNLAPSLCAVPWQTHWRARGPCGVAAAPVRGLPPAGLGAIHHRPRSLPRHRHLATARPRQAGLYFFFFFKP